MEKNCLFEILPIHEPISTGLIRKSTFDLTCHEILYQNTSCFLFQHCMLFKLKNKVEYRQAKVNFCFTLFFETIKNEQHTDGASPSKICGLKFQKEENMFVISSSTQTNELTAWRNYLATVLNQRGFHPLFRAVKKIGKDNFATVYLVTKLENEKKYAVKAFSKASIYSQEKGKESLIKEIAIMRKFSHKNLMKIYEVYQTQHSIYLITELLDGGQLAEKIHKKLSSFEIQLIMKGILEGLKTMHANNIMHRDIKPDNILLRRENDYDCVIVDFGLAEIVSEEYLFVRCGTPGYVAPEVVNLKDRNARYTCACDIFSLGIIFHLLLLKKSPFLGQKYEEILDQNKACRLNFDAPEYKKLSDNSLDLLKRMLECDPNKRITAEEAQKHNYFNLEYPFSEAYYKGQLLKVQPIKEQVGTSYPEVESPIMITTDSMRRSSLREDSCLKFKMKQNVMASRTQSGETIEAISSPELKRKPSNGFKPESRFKRLANQ